MASLNKVILIGHLTADPELKQTPSGVSVTTFSIGVTRRFTRAGEQAQSDFINIVAWRNTAEFICKYFRKGNAICICGSIQTRTYTDSNGAKRKAFEIVADDVNFADSKRDNGGNTASYGNNDYSAARTAAYSEPAPAYSSGSSSDFEEILSDDDLPF